MSATLRARALSPLLVAGTAVAALAAGVTPAGAAAPASATASVSTASTSDSDRLAAPRWECLAHHESTNRWHINSGNGYYGGVQFSVATWRYYGGFKYSGNFWPHKATRREQIVIARRVAFHGWLDRAPQGGRNAWPNTWYRCF